ncbi:hypothetical protein TGME49_223485 [Toxoplasma gondii ME49]|uniref:Uncharacterized protein n=1 Tax=Toxoplasma gondii (strain ATCC 50611 / Me49) TaxID=508771 RepID=S8GEM0_TOXGM|nr:hypothetical protein TGME49_223485 [Toxoplasma gondii ME49]EPT26859.1 hypothetical protein TGME49_223485 [Toxoplasma gondii ME49]|eukprot:XP_018635897.1 hypothetical protein TGME49_223485 [Toxoplasma gondii ME49]
MLRRPLFYGARRRCLKERQHFSGFVFRCSAILRRKISRSPVCRSISAFLVAASAACPASPHLPLDRAQRLPRHHESSWISFPHFPSRLVTRSVLHRRMRLVWTSRCSGRWAHVLAGTSARQESDASSQARF